MDKPLHDDGDADLRCILGEFARSFSWIYGHAGAVLSIRSRASPRGFRKDRRWSLSPIQTLKKRAYGFL